MSQSISLTAFSTALFSTWVFVEPFGVLFDCGDGIVSHLLQKSRKVKKAFISHADRDHVTGLMQFNQLNGRPKLSIHYPRDCGTFPALARFLNRFDPHTSGTKWSPLQHGDSIPIRNDASVTAFENSHVATSNRMTKSLSFSIQTLRRKLKAEFAGLDGHEIARLKSELGSDAIVDEIRETILTYSGDTPVEFDGRYDDTQILIHESTFLTREELGGPDSDRHRHSSLDAVMEMVAQTNIQHLILSHFSSRYDASQIDAAVAKQRERNNLEIPIDVVYPGELYRQEIKLH